MFAVSFGIFSMIYYQEKSGVSHKIEFILRLLLGGSKEFGSKYYDPEFKKGVSKKEEELAKVEENSVEKEEGNE